MQLCNKLSHLIQHQFLSDSFHSLSLSLGTGQFGPMPRVSKRLKSRCLSRLWSYLILNVLFQVHRLSVISVSCSCRTAIFNFFLALRGHSQQLEFTCRFLPCDLIHSMAFCSFKMSKRISDRRTQSLLRAFSDQISSSQYNFSLINQKKSIDSWAIIISVRSLHLCHITQLWE